MHSQLRLAAGEQGDEEAAAQKQDTVGAEELGGTGARIELICPSSHITIQQPSIWIPELSVKELLEKKLRIGCPDQIVSRLST